MVYQPYKSVFAEQTLILISIGCTVPRLGVSEALQIYRVSGLPLQKKNSGISCKQRVNSQTCVKQAYKTRHIFGFSDRWLLIAA